MRQKTIRGRDRGTRLLVSAARDPLRLVARPGDRLASDLGSGYMKAG